jgi:hypothetical protein
MLDQKEGDRHGDVGLATLYQMGELDRLPDRK